MSVESKFSSNFFRQLDENSKMEIQRANNNEMKYPKTEVNNDIFKTNSISFSASATEPELRLLNKIKDKTNENHKDLCILNNNNKRIDILNFLQKNHLIKDNKFPSTNNSNVELSEQETIDNIQTKDLDDLLEDLERKYLHGDSIPNPETRALYYKEKYGLSIDDICTAYENSQAKFNNMLEEFKDFLGTIKNTEVNQNEIIKQQENQDNIVEETKIKSIEFEPRKSPLMKFHRTLDAEFLSDRGNRKSSARRNTFNFESYNDTASAPPDYQSETVSEASDNELQLKVKETKLDCQATSKNTQNNFYESYKVTILLLLVILGWIVHIAVQDLLLSAN